MFKKLFKSLKSIFSENVVKAAEVLGDPAASEDDRREAGQFLAEASDKMDGYDEAERTEVANQAYERLLQLLAAPEPWVRYHALKGMNEIANMCRYEMERTLFSTAIRSTIPLLRDTDGDVRYQAAMTLSSLDDVLDEELARPVVNAIAANAEDPDAEVRSGALISLGSFGEKSTGHLPIILEHLDDPEATARRSAVSATWMVGIPGHLHDQTLGRLIQILGQDPDTETRGSAANAIGNIASGEPAALRALISSLEDPEEEVRHFSIFGIMDFGPAATQAVAHLERFLDDEEHQEGAILALDAIGTPEAHQMLQQRGLSAEALD